eukprot:Gregarina_sp_Poly_1__10942@NODE_85_length_15275_cov_135_187336_g73_i0_p4_GENE_NODE_85_length_15275_cov_135_187336_g73_i0NODE_85_length_15275_cov_135_187336_g73_i0_p4_ORF_typecomplete_len437_score31_70Nucleoside_tran/PF01733_18/6_4e02Nucleoside_tran/PF01733_18/3_4e31FA_desaturase/PF00487_24/67FA_desaturase/PF00487_24/0_59FA_desaturase/PF00487_24/1_1e03_NODE_85_length_15275_cov_135_187336_g73_i069818291
MSSFVARSEISSFVARNESLDSLEKGGFPNLIDSSEDAIKRVANDVEEDVPFDKLESLLYLVCGMSHLWYWNTMLNFMVDIQNYFYPDIPNISDNLTAIFETATLVGVAMTAWRGSLSQRNNVGWGIVFVIGSILTPVILGTCDLEHQVLSRNLLFVLATFTGIASGYQESIQFAFAACMPSGILCGWVSAGQGVCGVITFALYMLFSENVLKGRPLVSLWILMGLNCVLVTLGTASSYFNCRRPHVAMHISAGRQAVTEEKRNPNRPSAWTLFRQSYPGVLNVFFAFFVTFIVYPNVAPLRLGDSVTQTNVGMGMFQIGSMLGRFVPNAATWIPSLLLSTKLMSWGNAARVILIIWAILCANYSTHVFWGSDASHHILIFIVAATEGWIGTCGLIRSPMSVVEKYRSRVSAYAVVALLCGVCLGLWAIHIVKFTI